MNLLTEIAIKASNSETLNRAQAAQNLVDLITELPDKTPDVLKIRLQALYKYLITTKPKQAKTALKWVKLAINPYEVRSYLQLIHVKNGKMYGTDSHRLHVVNTNLADGNYDMKLQPSKETYYPDATRVIPKENLSFTLVDTQLTYAAGEVFIFDIHFIDQDLKLAVNKTYWSEAIQYFKDPVFLVDQITNRGEYLDSPIKIRESVDTGELAVVMPIRWT